MGSPRPRDSQWSRVYSWENTILDEALRSQLTLGESSALVVKALKRYQPAMATSLIIDARNGKKDWGSIGKSKIGLPMWARTPCVVFHEVSHLITPANAASDGREFVRIIRTLWKWHLGKNYTSSARRWGIKLSPPKLAPKPIAI